MIADGHVYCWGYNRDGELGNGTETNSDTPLLSAFVP
jgi:alpha-tubulin suppressor-like RCC1 family protein